MRDENQTMPKQTGSKTSVFIFVPIWNYYLIKLFKISDRVNNGLIRIRLKQKRFQNNEFSTKTIFNNIIIWR